MPAPPRMLVLPFPHGSHANPIRGAQSLKSELFEPRGAPASPGNNTPTGAFGNTEDCCPKASENERPCVSNLGWLYPSRTPNEKVRLCLTRHSSCAKP